jgi:L-3-cyanoalanine synthase/ cysteine synthase
MLNLIAGPHLITGNGVGFKPDILDMDVMDKVLEVMVITNLKTFSIQLWFLCNYVMVTEFCKWQVKSEDAVKMARELALKEGLLVSVTKLKKTVIIEA